MHLLCDLLHHTPLRVCRYDTRSDVKFEKDAPIIGLVLQRSHLVTGDEGHYAGVVSNLESRGAKVHLGSHKSRHMVFVPVNAVKLQPLAFVCLPVLGFAGRASGGWTCQALSAASHKQPAMCRAQQSMMTDGGSPTRCAAVA